MRRGIVGSREKARTIVLEGKVLVSGSLVSKPERLVDPSEPIELSGPPPRFVSRGGEKLDAALDGFGIDVTGLVCLDVGSSTGGFTDCLLQRGARSVVALDVGRGQLDWKVRNDARVRAMERTDVRLADPAAVEEVDLVVVDVSFISLRTVLPSIVRLAGRAPIVALVKPQFEVGRKRVGKGGIVRDPSLHEEAIAGVIAAAAGLSRDATRTVPSAVPGAQGNQEYFVLLEART